MRIPPVVSLLLAWNVHHRATVRSASTPQRSSVRKSTHVKGFSPFTCVDLRMMGSVQLQLELKNNLG